MIKVLVIILFVVLTFLIGAFFAIDGMRLTYYSGELHLNTKDSSVESVKFVFDNHPLNYISKKYVLFKVVNEDKQPQK